MFRAWLYRFARDRKANVAVITALTMVPIIFLLGMTLDFTQALRKKEQLDAAADAAAIAAVRPAMLMQPIRWPKIPLMPSLCRAANSLPGLAAVPTPTITVTDVGLQRTVSVSYNAASLNNFPKVLLNTASWPINGTATAQATSAPNMNLYLLMDDSPSMGIGATLTDINNLITATAPAKQPASSSQNCGFACHETNIGHDGGTKDNLTIARNNNITLRIDLVTNAVNQLLNTWSNCPQSGITGGVMQCMSALNNTSYKAALYTFDTGLNTLADADHPDDCWNQGFQHCADAGRSTRTASFQDILQHRLWHRYRRRAHQRQQHHAYPRPWQQFGGRYAAGSGLPCHRRRRGQDRLGRFSLPQREPSPPTSDASSRSTRRCARPSRTGASGSRSSTRSICNSSISALAKTLRTAGT